MKTGLRRVGIVGLSTLVVSSMMSLGAVTAQADWAATPTGSIGLVDTCPGATVTTACPTPAGTQGATLVYPGINGQAMGDIRIALPNSFQNGDTIDLAIFDRTATNDGTGTAGPANSNGQINADTAHMLGFSGTPVVTVNPTSYMPATAVGPTSATPGNTENAPVADVAPNKGVQPPVFTTSLVASSRAGGLATDIIRLRINAVQATIGTDPLAKWIVTVSGIKADLGSAVSPGELRVVPFAYNGTSAQTSATATGLFTGNLPGTPPNPPKIFAYTVPAYVAPVNFTVGAPTNLVADGTTQNVGPITIGETNNYSLQAGTYRVAIGGTSGATIQNGLGSNPDVTVTATNAATGESVTSPAAVVGNGLEFDLNQTNVPAANAGKVTITLSGLLLNTSTKGSITYTLSGGSIDGNANHSFLVTAGQSLEIPAGFAGVSGVGGVLADTAFAPGGVNQNEIVAPKNTFSAVATPVTTRIGGNDRYETAAKIALNRGGGDRIVLASGQNFPDALSSGYLAHQVGGDILLTDPGFLPAVTLDTMRQLGTSTVYIMGGTAAVSAGVEAQLRATPQYYPGTNETVGQGLLQVIRLGGANRYDTNKTANLYASAHGNLNGSVGRTQITFGQASKLTALVASGANFPDALAGGPATAGSESCFECAGLPLILTDPNSLSAQASTQMTALGIEQAVVLGGPAAVSTGVETSITGMGLASHRIGGATRYDTAANIASFEVAGLPTPTTSGGLSFDGPQAYLATGLVYADALAGAALAGGQGSPILLTDPSTLPAPTAAFLSANSALYDRVIALGLGFAVSNSVLNAANAAVSGP